MGASGKRKHTFQDPVPLLYLPDCIARNWRAAGGVQRLNGLTGTSADRSVLSGSAEAW